MDLVEVSIGCMAGLMAILSLYYLFFETDEDGEYK